MYDSINFKLGTKWTILQKYQMYNVLNLSGLYRVNVNELYK